MRLQMRSRTIAKTRMPMIATNVAGSVRKVCTPNTSKTTIVSTMPATSSELRDPVSALRRYAAIVVIKKIERATALPTEAIAVRSTKSAGPHEAVEAAGQVTVDRRDYVRVVARHRGGDLT
jgi:hypothetical protein